MPFIEENKIQQTENEEAQFESSPAYQGSLQQVLSNNVGAYVTIEFLIGVSEIVTRSGVIYSVGINYIVLFEEENNRYEVCDLYSIEFVTFYEINTGRRNNSRNNS